MNISASFPFFSTPFNSHSILPHHTHTICDFLFFALAPTQCFFFLCLLLFLPQCSMWDLNTPTGIEPPPTALEAWSRHHWIAREVLHPVFTNGSHLRIFQAIPFSTCSKLELPEGILQLKREREKEKKKREKERGGERESHIQFQHFILFHGNFRRQ